MAAGEGTAFGKYFLLKKIAAGGMGEIFLAKLKGPVGFEKLLVIKRILAHHIENDEFVETHTQESDPLWFVQAHVIRTFRPGLWASLSWGRTDGGENEIDGLNRNDERRETYWSVSLGLPINRQQGIKLSWIRGETERSVGADSETFLLGWSVMLTP